MSITGMRHLNGLAMGQGPLTSSTSPLWSPYGPYAMNQSQFGAFYGEADGAEDATTVSTADAAAASTNGQEGIVDKAKTFLSGKTNLLGMAVPTALLVGVGAYFLFFKKNAPLRRLNPWMGDSQRHRLVAQLRWARQKGDALAAYNIEEELAYLAGIPHAEWSKRSLIKGKKTKAKLKERSKRYAKSYKSGVKKGGVTARKVGLSKKPYTTKKDKAGRTMYFIDGKRVSKQKAMSKAVAAVANPRRRKNGTKKGQVRKTARRAYMKRNSAAQKRAQSNAAKAMKLYQSGKAKSLKAAWKMV